MILWRFLGGIILFSSMTPAAFAQGYTISGAVGTKVQPWPQQVAVTVTGPNGTLPQTDVQWSANQQYTVSVPGPGTYQVTVWDTSLVPNVFAHGMIQPVSWPVATYIDTLTTAQPAIGNGDTIATVSPVSVTVAPVGGKPGTFAVTIRDTSRYGVDLSPVWVYTTSGTLTGPQNTTFRTLSATSLTLIPDSSLSDQYGWLAGSLTPATYGVTSGVGLNISPAQPVTVLLHASPSSQTRILVTDGANTIGDKGGNILLASAPLPVTPRFSDVPASYYASTAIKSLAAQGIIQGYPNGTFKPQNPITAEDFALLLARVAGNATGKSVSLTQLTDAGVVNSGLLAGGQFITRGTAAAWVSATLEWIHQGGSGRVGQVSIAQAIASVEKAGVMVGVGGGHFDRSGEITRGQAALVINRLLSHA